MPKNIVNLVHPVLKTVRSCSLEGRGRAPEVVVVKKAHHLPSHGGPNVRPLQILVVVVCDRCEPSVRLFCDHSPRAVNARSVAAHDPLAASICVLKDHAVTINLRAVRRY